MSSEEEFEPDVELENPAFDRDLLIELIQHYEYLYNLGHNDYKNQQKKELAGGEIADTLTSTVPTCQKEWKNLRDRFNKENKTRSGAKATATKWPYYSQMLFYGRYSKTRKTTTIKPTTTIRNDKQARPSPSCLSEHSKAGTSTSMNIERRPSSACSSVWSTVENILSPEPPDTATEADEASSTRSSTDTSTSEPRVPREVLVTKDTHVSRKRTRKDAEIADVVQLAKKIAGQIEMAQGQRKNCHSAFVEYVLTRLNEMSPEESQEKRKSMLLILEG